MSIKIKPTAEIILRLGLDPNGTNHKYFTERCKDYMERFVPARPGSEILRGTAFVDGTRIIYDQVYARYQFYGHREDGSHQVNPANYSTPGTGPRWDRRMVTSFMPTIIEELQDKIKRGL